LLTSAPLPPSFRNSFALFFSESFWNLQNLAKIKYICKSHESKKCLLFRCRHAVVIVQILNWTNQCSLFMRVRYIMRSVMTNTEPRTVTHARDHSWTLDFANAFLSLGVISRAELAPLPWAYARTERRCAPLARGLKHQYKSAWIYTAWVWGLTLIDGDRGKDIVFLKSQSISTLLQNYTVASTRCGRENKKRREKKRKPHNSSHYLNDFIFHWSMKILPTIRLFVLWDETIHEL
jgi:hypothetical protein